MLLRFGLLGILVLAMTPMVQAQTGGVFFDGFEDDTVGQDPTADWYTFNEIGTGGQTIVVSSSQAKTGTKSLILNEAAGAFTSANLRSYGFTPSAAVTADNHELCPETGDTGIPVSFAFRLDALPDLATESYIFFGLAASGQTVYTTTGTGSMGLIIEGDGDAYTIIRGFGTATNQVPDLIIAPDTWYTVDMSFDCIASVYGVTAFFPGQATGTQSTTTTLPTVEEILTFSHYDGTPATTGSYSDWWIDDLQLTGSEPPTPGAIFCADPTLGESENWGYDYKEDTEFGDAADHVQGLPPHLDTAFIQQTDSGNQAFLGKAFTPGTQAIRQVARIETDTEGTSSTVRLAFTTGAATLSEGSTGDGGADQAIAGNGRNDGNFEDNIQAVLVEDGDQWVISIQYTVAGSGLTQILGSANYGADPNSPHTFDFIVNSGSEDITGPLVDVDNNTVFTGSIAANTAQLRGESGVILSRSLPAGLQGSEWKDSWIMSVGSNSVFQTWTVIDDNDAGGTSSSTCIFDLLGTAVVVGESGGTPVEFVVQPTPTTDPEACSALFCPPAGGIGGLSSSQLSLFLGIVLVASFAASMNEKTGAGAAGLAIFALLGVFIAYSLGYIQLWVVLILFAIGLGGIFLGLLNHGRSEAM